jgi:dihydroxy-acid dehydratase
MTNLFPLIQNSVNPYRDTVIGKANEPITVAGLLDRSRQIMGTDARQIKADWTLENIYDRLEDNAPRIAIIGGSADHPAHIMDYQTMARAAVRIWQNGGVPFQFSTPVLCDGTAQDNQGMSYSLQSRNAVASMVINQIEAHSYHGAVVIQGCDKQPLGVMSALAQLDRLRQYREEAPFFATFVPSHVLSGGSYPEDLVQELKEVAERAEKRGAADIAEDIRDTLEYVLVCSTNTSFQGVFERAKSRGLITEQEHKNFEKRLAVSTCDSKGGICAFNGTGNSSRHFVSGLGLVHREVELLIEPPSVDQMNTVIDSLGKVINDPAYSVSNLVIQNIRNAIRIHSASGGSTNLLMHIVAVMIYSGYRFSLWDYDRIRQQHPIPDLFDYSLTGGRDIFTLAQQCCSGDSRGMETLFFELLKNGVPMDVDAPTIMGSSWKERLADQHNLDAAQVSDRRIILPDPRRPFSGVDVLTGNFFESAAVKISGMPTPQLNEFDSKLYFVLYFDNEDEANRCLLDSNYLGQLKENRVFSHDKLLSVFKHNRPEDFEGAKDLPYSEIFDQMTGNGALKLAVVISGQGPAAFGMPEMYTPMQHINANRAIRKLVTVISDGRYSGVTLGAAIGHMTPEAFYSGGILYLETGDVLFIGLREKRIDLVDDQALKEHQVVPAVLDEIRRQREMLAGERKEALNQRQKRIAAANRLVHHTDAAHGVVPQEVFDDATLNYSI